MGHPAVLRVLLEGELTVIPADDGMFAVEILRESYSPPCSSLEVTFTRWSQTESLCFVASVVWMSGSLLKGGNHPQSFGRCVGHRGFQRVFWSLQ